MNSKPNYFQQQNYYIHQLIYYINQQIHHIQQQLQLKSIIIHLLIKISSIVITIILLSLIIAKLIMLVILMNTNNYLNCSKTLFKTNKACSMRNTIINQNCISSIFNYQQIHHILEHMIFIEQQLFTFFYCNIILPKQLQIVYCRNNYILSKYMIIPLLMLFLTFISHITISSKLFKITNNNINILILQNKSITFYSMDHDSYQPMFHYLWNYRFYPIYVTNLTWYYQFIHQQNNFHHCIHQKLNHIQRQFNCMRQSIQYIQSNTYQIQQQTHSNLIVYNSIHLLSKKLQINIHLFSTIYSIFVIICILTSNINNVNILRLHITLYILILWTIDYNIKFNLHQSKLYYETLLIRINSWWKLHYYSNSDTIDSYVFHFLFNCICDRLYIISLFLIINYMSLHFIFNKCIHSQHKQEQFFVNNRKLLLQQHNYQNWMKHGIRKIKNNGNVMLNCDTNMGQDFLKRKILNLNTFNLLESNIFKQLSQTQQYVSKYHNKNVNDFITIAKQKEERNTFYNNDMDIRKCAYQFD